MFQSPPKVTGYVAPAQPIDVDQRYVVNLVDLVDLGPTKFPNPNDDPNNPTHRIQWKFSLAAPNANGKFDIVQNTDGEPYEHYDYTSSKTGKSTKAGGKTETARQWMEALFGRMLDDDEITPDIAIRLRGKVAVALFEEKESGGKDGQESYTRLKILRLSPYKKAARATAAAAEQKAAAENAAATVQRARAATAVAAPEEDDSAPF